MGSDIQMRVHNFSSLYCLLLEGSNDIILAHYVAVGISGCSLNYGPLSLYIIAKSTYVLYLAQ